MVLTSETLTSSTSLKSSSGIVKGSSSSSTGMMKISSTNRLWNQSEFIMDQEPFHYYPYEDLPKLTVKFDGIQFQSESIFVRYAFSFLAATCAELATYPLDLTKTRLQLQGEVAVSKFNGTNEIIGNKRGMFRTAYGIVNEEGLFKLWQGITPAVYRHLIYSGTRMTVYEFMREDVLGKNDDGTIALWKAVFAGVFAGGLAQFLASPADLVKVQLQAEGRRKLLGMQPRVHGTWHAFTQIIHQGGIRGLWKGWVPNVQRAAFVNLGDLTTYDTAKRFILLHSSLKDNLFTHALASTFSGLVAAVLGTPADTIKTRIMNQPTNEKGVGLVYKGSIDCLLKSMREEGFFSLYKGFIPCWLRMGPWSLMFWITYEKLRYYGGVRSF